MFECESFDRPVMSIYSATNCHERLILLPISRACKGSAGEPTCLPSVDVIEFKGWATWPRLLLGMGR